MRVVNCRENANAILPIDVTEAGIVSSLILLESKAESHIDTNEEDNFNTSINDPLNAPTPIDFTESEIINSFNA